MLKYFFYRFIFILIKTLPRQCAYWVAYTIAGFRYLVIVKIRRAVRLNIRHILKYNCSGEINEKEVSKITRAVFWHFARYIVDFFGYTSTSEMKLRSVIKITNEKYVKEAFALGKGAIALTAHLGNWELCGTALASSEFLVNVVALDHRNKRINDMFIKQREKMGEQVIPAGASPRRYLEVLRKNQMIGLLGDRVTTSSGIEINFFGRTVLIPRGPAVLSLRTGATVLPCFMLCNGDGTFNMVYEPPIYPHEYTGDFNESVKAMTQRMTSIIEGYIKKYPSQWSIFYKVWGDE